MTISRDTDVVVIGAGGTGLAAASVAHRAGLRVVVLEAGPAVGGLARSLSVEGEPIEAYYHHIFPQDRETIELISQLGMDDRLEWVSGPMALVHREQVYSFDGPLDMLRFTPLRLHQRGRFAVGSAALAVGLKAGDFDHATCDQAGPRWFGRSAYETIWRPLLTAKFGPYAGSISMAWLVARIRQRAAARRVHGDRLGYFRGGVGSVLTAYGQMLAAQGVEIRTGVRVTRLEADGPTWIVGHESPDLPRDLRTASVVAAISGGLLRRMTDLPAAYLARLDSIPYRGIVCALIELDRPLSDRYWTSVTDRLGLGCVGVIEHTNLVGAERYGGRSLVYLAHYVSTQDRAWTASAEELVDGVRPVIRLLNPNFDDSWILNITVSRDQFAQPVPLADGGMIELPTRPGIPGLFHASLAHIYPDDRGVSLALRLGARVGDVAAKYAHGIDSTRGPTQVTSTR